MDSPGSRVSRTLRTARHIPFGQLAARLRFVRLRRRYARRPEVPVAHAGAAAAGTVAAGTLPSLPGRLLAPDGSDALEERAAAFAAGRFRYLGTEADFGSGVDWDASGHSPLWAYQLHYLGCLVDLCLTGRTDRAGAVLDSWMRARGHRWDPVAWHPYPVSTRLVNVCLAAGAAGGFDALGRGASRLVAVHAAYLLEHLELDVRGNHLLENAVALLVAARHLEGPLTARLEDAGRELVSEEVGTQILPDGGHFELSPMYHLVVMHRLLLLRALLPDGDALTREVLSPALVRMAAWLEAVVCPDGGIPLLGDSARGFAPPAGALLELAGRGPPRPRADGIESLPGTGLHVLRNGGAWAVMDGGRTCPDALPAHGQADALTVEIWMDGHCVVGDPGVHDYTGPERQWGRSSRAHSTVTVDDRDDSEVYERFRVGGRMTVLETRREEGPAVRVAIRPWGLEARCERTLLASGPAGVEIRDEVRVPDGHAVRSRLHLHPDVTILSGETEPARTVMLRTPAGAVKVGASAPIRMEQGRASRSYGELRRTVILVQDLPRVAGVHVGWFRIESGGREPV